MLEDIKEKAIELRSEEIDEIIGKPPVWIIRRGATVFSFIILCLVAGSWLFKYPDIITAPVTITCANPPTALIARTGGKIASFYVKNDQSVNDGDYLAIIENSSNEQSIMELRGFISVQDMGTGVQVQGSQIMRPSIHSLGELQQPYLNYLQAATNLHRYDSLSLHQRKIESLANQMALTNKYLEKLKGQRYFQALNLRLSQIQFSRDSVLFSQEVPSVADFDIYSAQLINQENNYRNADLSVTNAEIQLSQIEQQIIELRLNAEKERRQLTDEVYRTLQTLKNQFDAWELNYVIKSNIRGKVVIGKFWSVNQTVKAGEVIVVILPLSNEVPYGLVTLNMENSGKVKIGEKVNIKLAGFPFSEYGLLEGLISSISLVPDQDKYYMEVKLKQGLKTNFGLSLPFNHEMKGTAEIITEDIRLLERLVHPFRVVFSQ